MCTGYSFPLGPERFLLGEPGLLHPKLHGDQREVFWGELGALSDGLNYLCSCHFAVKKQTKKHKHMHKTVLDIKKNNNVM